MSPSVELPELDPFVEDFQQFPFATLRPAARAAPVQAMVEPGWYIVTTIELAREVLTDPGRFSNQVSRRTSPSAGGRRKRSPQSGLRAFPTYRRCCSTIRQLHTPYRRMVQRALSRHARWPGWSRSIANVAEELAADCPTAARSDLIEVFTRPLPVWAISRVLGTPGRPARRRPAVDRCRDGHDRRPAGPPSGGPQVEQDLLDYPADDRRRAGAATRRSPEMTCSARSSKPTAARPRSGRGGDRRRRTGQPDARADGRRQRKHPAAAGRYRLATRSAAGGVGSGCGPIRHAGRSRSSKRRCVSLARRRPCSAASYTTPRSVGIRFRPERRWSSRCCRPTGTRRYSPDGDRFDPDRPTAQRHVAFGQGIHACIGNILARMEARHAVQRPRSARQNASTSSGTNRCATCRALSCAGWSNCPCGFGASPTSPA